MKGENQSKIPGSNLEKNQAMHQEWNKTKGHNLELFSRPYKIKAYTYILQVTTQNIFI